MKILIFVKTFANPTLTFIYNEVTELAKYHNVRIITCERKNEALFPFENIIEIPFAKNRTQLKYQTKLQYLDIAFAFKSQYFRKKVKEEINSFQPDIIHTHFGFESWLFLENHKVSKIPVFISFHGYDASHKLKSNRYLSELKKYLSREDVIPIFVSKFMKQHVEKSANMVFNKSRILYYGTDIEFFKRLSYDQNITRFNFLQVSSFAEKKGHEFTVRAFAKLINKLKVEESSIKVKLVLAGDGPLNKSIEELVNELNISEFVSFVGLVNIRQAKDLMENADAFVHHSVISASVGDMEGIPNAIMEAMAMELPILSTIHSGIPELVENGINGFLVEERDIDKYAETMFNVLSWRYLSKNRVKIEKLFEKKQHAKSLIKYYEELITS